MKQQGTYLSCCDVLSSLVASHGAFLMQDTFTFGNFSWPSILETRGNHLSNGWSILELDGFNRLTVVDCISDSISCDDCSKQQNIIVVEGGWELVHRQTEEGHSQRPVYSTTTDMTTVATTTTTATTDKESFTTSYNIIEASKIQSIPQSTDNEVPVSQTDSCQHSYRDVLLIPRVVSDESLNRRTESLNRDKYKAYLSHSNSWKPRFGIRTVGWKRLDRSYGPQLASNNDYDYHEGEIFKLIECI